MDRKCKNCGKTFNVGAFSEEYCPYCGAVLEEKDRQKIRNREYFWKKYALGLFALIVIIVWIIVSFAVPKEKDNLQFEVNFTQLRSELKTNVGGMGAETVISVYGTVKAYVDCTKINITCIVYNKFNEIVCVPAGVFSINNGETIIFKIYAEPTNLRYLDTPLRANNFDVKILS